MSSGHRSKAIFSFSDCKFCAAIFERFFVNGAMRALRNRAVVLYKDVRFGDFIEFHLVAPVDIYMLKVNFARVNSLF